MSMPERDYTIFNRLGMKRPPVGVKYLFSQPEEIGRLNIKLDLCEMPGEALGRGTAFYADADNCSCGAGAHVLFGSELPRVTAGGYVGAALEIFKEPRANRRVYEALPKMEPGTINYVVFAPLEKLPFDPDITLFFIDEARQAEILLRAMSYTTGEIWSSRTTFVVSCAWLLAYPFLSGNVNYVNQDLCFTMNVKKSYPEGYMLMSIPFDKLPLIIDNLKEMPWVPKVYTDERDDFVRRAFGSLGLTPH